MKQINIAFDANLYEQIKEQAKASRMAITDFIRVVMLDQMKNHNWRLIKRKKRTANELAG
jgi:hypothetical protein